MPIYRMNHKENYTKLKSSGGFLDDPRLSAKAKGIFAKLLTYPDEWEFHTKNISHYFKDGKTALQSGINELEEFGYLVIDQIRGKNGKINYIWNIYEEPREQLKTVP